MGLCGNMVRAQERLKETAAVDTSNTRSEAESEFGSSFYVSSGFADSGSSGGSGGVLEKSFASEYAGSSHTVLPSVAERYYVESVTANTQDPQDAISLFAGDDEISNVPELEHGGPSSGHKSPFSVRQSLHPASVIGGTVDAGPGNLFTETDSSSGGSPSSNQRQSSPIVPRQLPTAPDANTFTKSSTCGPSQEVISQPSQETRGTEGSTSPAAEHPLEPALCNVMKLPEKAAASGEDHTQEIHQPLPTRSYGVVERGTHVVQPRANEPFWLCHKLPGRLRRRPARIVSQPDVGFLHRVGSETPHTFTTTPADCGTQKSATTAMEAGPDPWSTHTQSPSSTYSIAVELDDDPSISRCHSPWLDTWFEEGPTSSFREFGASIACSSTHTDSAGAPLDGHLTVTDLDINASEGHCGESIQAKSSETDPRRSGNSSSPPNLLGKRSNKATRNNNHGDGGCNDGDFDDGDDNDGPSHPQRRRTTGPTEAEGTLDKFACPYQKIFPLQNHLCGLPHGKRTFYGWDTVSRVKQHVLRSHGKSYHCSHCWKAFSAKPGEGRCAGGKCPRRPQPDKHWLADEQVVRLETGKIPNSADGWYRLVAILFPDMPEEGEGGYRSSYTPYYCMWTGPTKELAPTVSQDAGMDSFSPWGFPTHTAPGFPFESVNTVDDPESRVPFDLPGQLEMGEAEQQPCAFPAAEATACAGILDQNCLWENTLNEPGPAVDDSTRTAENSTAEGFRSSAPYSSSSVTNSTPSTVPSNPYCTCTLSGTCSHCRLKQRLKRLESENESFRATIEKARSLVGKHDGVLQDVHDSRRAPDSVMEELWKYQDELRKVLSLCRE